MASADLARVWLRVKMRRTLLGKRTIHGTSQIASKIIAERALTRKGGRNVDEKVVEHFDFKVTGSVGSEQPAPPRLGMLAPLTASLCAWSVLGLAPVGRRRSLRLSARSSRSPASTFRCCARS